MKDKTVLFDADSLLYQAVYKIITFGEIRRLYLNGNDRIDIEIEILQRGYDRFEKIAFDIFNEIETEHNIVEVKYFFTTCRNNFRKQIDSEYKENRKVNSKWVEKLREYLLDYLDGSYASDEYEADDLIYFISQLLEVDDYIICSIDKDLKQIEGLHFDYYRIKKQDAEGNKYKVRKGFQYVTKESAEMLIFEMMLTGDVSDNIKGIYGIGQKKAKKLLEGKNAYSKFRVLCNEYKKESSENWKQRIKTNAELLIFK